MGLTGKRQAVEEAPGKAGGKKKAGSRVAAKMSEAAGKALEKHRERIVDSLVQGTLGGNTSSAKLLLSLPEGQVNREEKENMQLRGSQAEKLASEPEWSDKEIDATAEAGFQQR